MRLTLHLAAALATGAWLACGCHPAVAPTPGAETYVPDQTQGEIKVVLYEVAQLTVFTDQWSAGSQATGISAAPAFKVVWLLDVPQADASALEINPTNSVQISVEGKVVSDEAVPGVVRGISNSSGSFEQSTVKSYFSPPKPSPGHVAQVEETVLKGVRIEADHVDLKIRLNWKKRHVAFEFKDVPVN